MIGTLGSTTDPVMLVPGSVETLHADADDLDSQAADLDTAADDVAHRTVPSWDSDTAQMWTQRRRDLVATLEAVAGIYRTVGVVLRAHAEVVGWAQSRAQLAIGLWATGVNLAAADGAPVLGLRPTGSGPFAQPGLPATDAGAVHRHQAEMVLEAARHEVRLSGMACSQVLDEMSAGMPDGQFHFDEFLAGIGDWVAGIADLVYRFNTIRFMVDAGAWIDDAREMGQGLWETGDYLRRNPFEAVPVLLNTQQLHDNPGRWWGNLFPDLALTAAGGVGLLTKAGTLARLGDNLADLAQRYRAMNWADDTGAIDMQAFLRREPVLLGDGSTVRALDVAEEAIAAARYADLPPSRVRAQGPEGVFQNSVYGDNERLIRLANGRDVYPDGFTPQYGAIGDAKFVDSPSSWYVPDSLGNPGLAQIATQQMDDKLRGLAAAAEAMGGNGVVEIATNSLDAARFIESRMRALDISGYVRLVEVAQ